MGRDRGRWEGTAREVRRDSERWEEIGSGEEGQELVGSNREECGRIGEVGDGLGEVGKNWES